MLREAMSGHAARQTSGPLYLTRSNGSACASAQRGRRVALTRVEDEHRHVRTADHLVRGPSHQDATKGAARMRGKRDEIDLPFLRVGQDALRGVCVDDHVNGYGDAVDPQLPGQPR